ncbi:hypothetical protein EDD15DRAFT_2131904, partial [Pisolithus albus]
CGKDVSQRPWAHPTACFALGTYFKVCRAEEEIKRLNIEIHQVITYMCDEEHFLRTCEEKISNLHSQSNGSHLKRLHDIAMLPGFSGTLIPGVSALKGPGESNSGPAIIIPSSLL